MSSTNASVTTLAPISQDSADRITNAYKALLAVLVSEGRAEGIPNFAECGTAEYEKIVVRSWKAINEFQSTARERALAGIKGDVAALLSVAVETARAERYAVLALPEKVRAKIDMSQFSVVKVALSDIASCFPRGTTEPDMVKALHDMKFEVRKAKNGPYNVHVALDPTSDDKSQGIAAAAE